MCTYYFKIVFWKQHNQGHIIDRKIVDTREPTDLCIIYTWSAIEYSPDTHVCVFTFDLQIWQTVNGHDQSAQTELIILLMLVHEQCLSIGFVNGYSRCIFVDVTVTRELWLVRTGAIGVVAATADELQISSVLLAALFSCSIILHMG